MDDIVQYALATGAAVALVGLVKWVALALICRPVAMKFLEQGAPK